MDLPNRNNFYTIFIWPSDYKFNTNWVILFPTPSPSLPPSFLRHPKKCQIIYTKCLEFNFHIVRKLQPFKELSLSEGRKKGIVNSKAVHKRIIAINKNTSLKVIVLWKKFGVNLLFFPSVFLQELLYFCNLISNCCWWKQIIIILVWINKDLFQDVQLLILYGYSRALQER